MFSASYTNKHKYSINATQVKQFNTMQYNTIQYYAYNAMQCNAIQSNYSIGEHEATQCSLIPYAKFITRESNKHIRSDH